MTAEVSAAPCTAALSPALSPPTLLSPSSTSAASSVSSSLAEIIRLAYETNAAHARTSSGPPPIDLTALLTNIALASAAPSALPGPPPPTDPSLLSEWHRFLEQRSSGSLPPAPPSPSSAEPQRPSSPAAAAASAVKKRKRYPVHNCGVCLLPCIPFPSSARFVTCSVCALSVHIECYGISKMSKAHSRQLRRRWKCEKCKDEEKGAAGPLALSPSSSSSSSPPAPLSPATCLYCPSRSFALKRASNGAWVHVVCALFLPALALTLHHQHYGSSQPLPSSLPYSAKKKHRSFHLVTGVNAVPEEHYDLDCDVCGERSGLCVQCRHPSCTTSYHVTCALTKGWCLRADDAEEGGGDGDEVDMNTWCGEHTPEDWTLREEGGSRYVLEGRGLRRLEVGEVPDMDGEWDEDEDDMEDSRDAS